MHRRSYRTTVSELSGEGAGEKRFKGLGLGGKREDSGALPFIPDAAQRVKIRLP